MENQESKTPIIVKLDSNSEAFQVVAQTLIQDIGEIGFKIMAEKSRTEIEIAQIESETEKRRLDHQAKLIEAELQTDLRNKIAGGVAIGTALVCYIFLKIYADVSSDLVAILSGIVATSIVSIYKISGNFYKRIKTGDDVSQ